MLNKEQQMAVDQINGPVLIIAGAGSGKTTTLINRTAKIINSGVDPSKILLLTFTNKAADEMKIRGQKLLDDRFDKVTACTYHSFCNILLRTYAGFLAKDGNFLIIDQNTAVDTIKMLMSKMEISQSKGYPHADVVNSIISSSINMEMSIDDTVYSAFDKFSNHISTINKIKNVYEDYKKLHNQLDYDDLMLRTVDMLMNEPVIRASVSNKYEYIMVDEYQDSNSIQLKLLKLLCTEKDKPNVCVVGDDQQSIYLFRGAQFLNIINYPREFEGCKTIILNQNYRSNQKILDLSNEIIKEAPDKFDKNLKGQKTKGEKPYLVHTVDSKAAAEYIIRQIKSYKKKGVPLSEIAVISRGSKATSYFEAKLAKENIPYDKYGGVKFIDRGFVQDISAFLKISINLFDEVAWFRWLSTYPGIGPKAAMTIYQAIEEVGSIEGLNNVGIKRFLEYKDQLIDIYKKVRINTFQDGYKILSDYYFDIRKLQIEQMKKDKRTTVQGIESAEWLLETDKEDKQTVLDDIAEKYTKPENFLADLVLSNTNEEDDSEKMIVSTVHSIKGLEFKAVFVFDCVEGAFPFDFGCGEKACDQAKEYYKKEMEEERRILYVALTRAKDDLYVMFPETINVRGNLQKATLNRYLTGPRKKGLMEEIFSRY